MAISSFRPSVLFLGCALLLGLHQLTQYGLHWRLPAADNWLDPLLAMPLLLTLLVWERRLLFRRGPHYRLSLTEIVLATGYVALLSEWLFPLLSDRFTADPWDLLAFAAGALLYGVVDKRN